MAYKRLLSDAYYKDKYTGVEIDRRLTDVDSKQDIITDLDEIREGAAKGETAYQLPEDGIPMSDLSQAVQDAIAKAETVEQAVEAIQALIPPQASESNQLADKDFVNSSVATNTANFIGTFNSVQELEDYSGTLTNNDYAFVIGQDAQGNTQYDRYKYVAESEQWLYEYTLNNSSFTAEQWAAINSGMTASLVTKVNDLPTKAELDTALDGKVDKVIGKGLSTNDYTDAEKAVVEGLTGDTETFELKERRTRGGVFGEGTGMAAIQQITGKTGVWNQLVAETFTTSEVNGITMTPNAVDHCIDFSGTGTARYSGKGNIIPDFVVGHLYYYAHQVIANPNGVTGLAFGLLNQQGLSSTESNFATIFTAVATGRNIGIQDGALGVNVTGIKVRYTLVDLTVFFAGNVPTGYTTDTFKAEHPLPYYDYDAGSLLPVNPTGIFSRGFNLWNEDWEKGAWNSIGNKSNSESVRCVNHIAVFPSTTYFMGLVAPSYVCLYDRNKVFINRITVPSRSTFETTAETAFITFNTATTYGPVYKYDICINLSNPAKNGTYEPYAGSTLPIDLTTATAKLDGQGASVIPFADGVNAIGDVKDIIRNGDALKRIGSRAYQAGDESDTTVVTDMTNTIYVLTTPEHYIWDNPLGLFYPYDNLGTEQALPEDTSSTPQLAVPMTVKYEPNGASFMRYLNEKDHA